MRATTLLNTAYTHAHIAQLQVLPLQHHTEKSQVLKSLISEFSLLATG